MGDADPEPVRTPPRRRSASRVPREDPAFTAVAPVYEEREIVIAQGLDFHNTCTLTEEHWVLPDAINRGPHPNYSRVRRRPLAGLVINADGSAEYTSDRQRVHYRIRPMIVTKEDFKSALEEEGIIVVYDGHARYGRGPCFGDPGNHLLNFEGTKFHCPQGGQDWGDGSDTTLWGQWKYGFPYIPIPISETLHHSYNAVPVFASVDLPASEHEHDRHPDIRMAGWAPGDRRAKRLMTKTLEEVVSEMTTVRDDLRRRMGRTVDTRTDVPEDLEGLVKHEASQLNTWLSAAADGRAFWVQTLPIYYRALGRSFRIYEPILDAGWNATSVTPMDLGGTDLRCRCFCHFGCSTFKHNHKILRRPEHKGWVREGNERYAYFTTDLSGSATSSFWLYHLFSDRERSAGREWGPLLERTKNRTNDDLDYANEGFHII